ncbi:VOC family protein [Dyella kyungheensis]|uniref:VOC family protein n=1 Tax=Dyella kyungheensis TaxID=1242174 RepID=A0ABS2JPR5_9GAMM|nr:VOC family protein [Dyella kyungheensis]MBM7120841.1 VOC family protein [Dyella kyungheensis]
MIDHVGLAVSGYERSREFYRSVLAPLGGELVMEVTAEQTGDGSHGGFGMHGRPTFWIGTSHNAHSGSVHVAFTAPDRDAVRAFHRLALEAGATDNGAPGLRPHYHEHYYGAFVLDPDGHNIEAVCHSPE